MKLQNISLATNGYDDMYFRGGELKEHSLFVKKGEKVSFDTYFNCFSYTKYRDYTILDAVDFSCFINGEANVSLYAFDGENQTLLATKYVKDAEIFLSCSFENLPKLGILYPVIEAITDIYFENGKYFSEVEANNIDCAIAICTYKREDCLIKNLEILKNASFANISKVYVVDNGNSLDIDELSNKFVSIIPNKNYGGSGGFTRGIMEAKKGGHSHVILMDDDVIIDAEILDRMSSFVSILSSEFKNAHFSAAMLPLSKPYLQYEMGARWDGGAVKSFKQNVDVRLKENLVKNCITDDVQYGGWWCFLLPLSDTDKFGLPYPMFIKFDDIEYGSRCSSLAPIITMNGIAVTHEDFNSKYSMHLDYYKLRNQLIMIATHNMQSRFGLIFRLMKTSAYNLFLYRYDAMPLFFKAFDDFLQGPEFLINTDEEILNKEIMALAPKAKPLSEIEGWDPSMRNTVPERKTGFFKTIFIVLTLGGHIVPRFMLKRKIASFPPLDAKLSWAFLRKRTIQYQLGSDYGFDLGRSVKKFFKNFFKCIGMAFKILFKYGKAKKNYLKQKDYLTSFDFWEKHLEINCDNATKKGE